jgi:hypothetical protein
MTIGRWRVTKDQRQEHSPPEEQTTEEAWHEVGRQFESLGESLSKAFRAAWEDEQTQQHVRSMRDGLEKMVDKVDRAVKEAGESEQRKRLRTEAEKTAESLRKAGEQTWEEARPQLVSALTTVNAELQRLIKHLEEKPASASEPSAQGQDT